VTTGLVGCVELGVTVVVKRFSGAPFKGIVVRYQHPYFSVVFEDGDTEDYTGKQLAFVLSLWPCWSSSPSAREAGAL
jgi:hypothetical protein